MIRHAHTGNGTPRTAQSHYQISDRVLVELMAHGDKDALKLLYLRHCERVHRFVLRLAGTESLADEVVNEVFLSAWRHAGRFQGKSQVATWLLSIARFKTVSEYRRRREFPLDEHACAAVEDPADGPAASVEKCERRDILENCLAKLAPIHREVINLIYYRDQKIEETARSIGAPAATVKTRLHYARNRMAQLLSEAGIDRTWVSI
jgi:RNA polymerase sigma-70 factor, ECF subfamily